MAVDEDKWGQIFEEPVNVADLGDLMKVELVITEVGARFVNVVSRLTEHLRATSVTLTDKVDLAIFKHCFSWRHCARRIVPVGTAAGVSNSSIGELIVHRNSGNYKFSLSFLGFGIDGDAYDYSASFFSPGGASFVDMVYFRVHGEPVPVLLFDYLSGVTFIKAAQRGFHTINAEWRK